MGRLLARLLGCKLVITLKQLAISGPEWMDRTQQSAVTSESHESIFINVTACSKEVNFQIVFNCKMGVSKNAFPFFFFWRQQYLQKINHTTIRVIAGLHATAEERGNMAPFGLILQHR